MQVASLTSLKGPCDLAGAVKSALDGPPVRCAMDSESLAPWNARHEFRSRSKVMACGSSVAPA